jgi:hypothetical protein
MEPGICRRAARFAPYGRNLEDKVKPEIGAALSAALLIALFLPGLPLPLKGYGWPSGASFISSALADDDDDDDNGDDDDGDDRYDDDDRDDDDDGGAATADDDDDDDDVVAAPLEFIIAAPGAAIDSLAAAGFNILARDDIALIDTAIARINPPAGIDLEAARAAAIDLAPGAFLDVNGLYRPDELSCGDDGCAAFDLVSWPQPAASCEATPLIGLIDTGVNAEHAALSDAEIELIPVVAADRAAGSKTHGTAIAALLAGAPQSRSPGLLPRARLVAVEAFHRRPDGTDAADAFDLARGLDRLADAAVPIVNLSFSGPDNVVFRRVVEAALAKGMLLVAAVGNTGPHAEPLYPAAYEGVVGVTAIDREKRVYRQAVQGPHVDFAAPGVRLWTAASVSGGRFRSGTSYAAPFVTAALAVAAHQDEDASRDHLAAIAAGATDLGASGRDDVFGWGLPPAPDCRERAAAN